MSFVQKRGKFCPRSKRIKPSSRPRLWDENNFIQRKPPPDSEHPGFELRNSLYWQGGISTPIFQGESMQSRFLQIPLRIVFVLLAVCFTIAVARAQNPTHVVSGTTAKTNAAAKTLAHHTPHGPTHTTKFTDKPPFPSLMHGPKGAHLAGKQ